MHDYLIKLKSAMQSQGCPPNYINDCTKYASKLLNKGLPVIFDREHFSRLIGFKLEELEELLKKDNYRVVKIPKKDGHRDLYIPNPRLKLIQKWMLMNLISKVKISKHARGFITDTSLVDNAIEHVNKDFVVSLDIRDFFPSINKYRVYRIFRSLGYCNDLAGIFTALLVTNNGLPQGAPTSPYLSHIVCKKLDSRISKELKHFEGCSFTRYADDFSISGGNEILEKISNIIYIISSEGFELNFSKTRIQSNSQKQLVTGLVVNEKVNVPSSYKRRLKQEIYYCKKYGVNSHMKRLGINKSNYKLYLYGKAYYIKMINQKLGEKFLSELNEIDWPY
ncbi:reverse transcriptase family protein [Neobacillus massiliamazoniensis]|uniref:RNA-directed DNA polymerase n=1 Tax=Neobacillus massiliamazoniensis TaxID=1499688 RepID=A0A0U1NYG0_9BACI|nr:reverse transcriptase family protein [Neobacillus massiliamazoniensis]CRK83036.1 RNA-directed DNA polymerase [Neobacillus massiliamazoniensis]